MISSSLPFSSHIWRHFCRLLYTLPTFVSLPTTQVIAISTFLMYVAFVLDLYKRSCCIRCASRYSSLRFSPRRFQVRLFILFKTPSNEYLVPSFCTHPVETRIGGLDSTQASLYPLPRSWFMRSIPIFAIHTTLINWHSHPSTLMSRCHVVFLLFQYIVRFTSFFSLCAYLLISAWHCHIAGVIHVITTLSSGALSSIDDLSKMVSSNPVCDANGYWLYCK